MPSPYATQRPTTTRASFSNALRASRARRDLPIPGGPTIVASEHDDLAPQRRTRVGARRARVASDERRDDRAGEGRARPDDPEHAPGSEGLGSCPSPRPQGRLLDDDGVPDEASTSPVR